MSTHDKIDLPPPAGHYYEWDGVYGKRKFTAAPHNGRECDRAVAYYTADQVRAAIEADRKRRGEPVAYVPLVSGSGKPEWSGTLPIGHELYEMYKDKCPWKPLYTAPQPAEPVKGTPIREHIEKLEQDPKKKAALDRARERLSAGEIRVEIEPFHVEQPAEPVLDKYQPCGCVICTCEDDVQCQGCGARHCGRHPIGELSDPVYVSAEPVKGLSAGQLAEILTAYITPEIIREALEKLENAPWELSASVKVPNALPSGTNYSVEPHGNGYAIYQGRDKLHHGTNLAHLTECTPEFSKRIESALNAMSEPVKVPSDADAKHVQDFINCDGMGAVIVEGPQYSAVVRALLARYSHLTATTHKSSNQNQLKG